MKRSRAQDYFVMAVSYAAAVDALAGKGAKVAAPFHMMTGHALELSLKSVLAHLGRDEEWLMMAGHNLGSCYRRAISVGFEGEAAERVACLVEKLNRPHYDQRFRYPSSFADTPSLDEYDAAETLQLHLDDVRSFISRRRRSISRNGDQRMTPS